MSVIVNGGRFDFRVFPNRSQFLNDTSDQPGGDHQTKPLTPSELESIEARMMQRNWHLTERCAFYGLDQPGEFDEAKKKFWRSEENLSRNPSGHRRPSANLEEPTN